VVAELDVSGSGLGADECLALANARHLYTLDLSGTAVAASAASLEAVPFQPAEMGLAPRRGASRSPQLAR
jgi:hypothetical protein